MTVADRGRKRPGVRGRARLLPALLLACLAGRAYAQNEQVSALSMQGSNPMLGPMAGPQRVTNNLVAAQMSHPRRPVGEVWWARATGWVCTVAPLDKQRNALQGVTPMMIADNGTVHTAQPATQCGVITDPPTNATGWLFMTRTGPDEITYNVSVINWLANNTLRSAHIHAGGPGVSYANTMGGGVMIELTGNPPKGDYSGAGLHLVRHGTFGSADLANIVEGRTLDDFLAVLAGEWTHFVNGQELPLMGAFISFHSSLHPVVGELRGQVQPAIFHIGDS